MDPHTDQDLSDHEMEVCLPQQESDSESSSNMSSVVFDQRTSVSQQDPDCDKSDDAMEASTPLGDPDWESSEKSGLMLYQRTGDDLLDTADEDQEEADLISEIERMLPSAFNTVTTGDAHSECWTCSMIPCLSSLASSSSTASLWAYGTGLTLQNFRTASGFTRMLTCGPE